MYSLPISQLRGIGEKKAAKLKKIGITTFKDVLYDYPSRYVDRRTIGNISEVSDQSLITIKAKVIKIQIKMMNKNRKEIMVLSVMDSFHAGEIVFFSPAYLKNKFIVNSEYFFYGKIEKSGASFKMMHPEFAPTSDKQFLNILPIYHSTLGIFQSELVNIHEQVLHMMQNLIEETLPPSIISLAKLCSLTDALKQIHFPQNEKTLKIARYRLIYEELFTLQLKLIILKNNYHKAKAPIFESGTAIESFIKQLPFRLTNAQSKAFNDILVDVQSGFAMNRLIQGDVGSGKTILAFLCLLLAVENGKQAVLMAPTAIL
ncbi:MAG: hypothetical protein ACD_19C00402G0001, partial [uncultured bacterium]